MTLNFLNIVNSLTRIEVVLANLDKAIREIGERAGRGQNRRSMNG